VGGQRHTPAALPPGKTRYPLYKRLGGPHGRSGRVRKISPPPGVEPRTFQPVAIRYTDWAIPAHIVDDSRKEILKLATKITNHLDICLERLSKTTKIHSKGIRYNSECNTTKSLNRPSPVDSARITPVTSQQETSSYMLGWCIIFFFFLARQPPVNRASSFTRFLDHTQRSTTVDRTPLDEWLARPRDLYVKIPNTHNRQTSMPPVGFEPTISAGERPSA
jgi:hypothetical protein